MPAEPSLVTGGRGFVGAWLCKALLERGDEVVSLRPGRAGGPALGARAARDRRARSVDVEGDLLDADGLARALGRQRGRLGLPSRGADDRRHRGLVARRRPSTRTSAARGRCSRPAASNGVERVVVASSDKAYGAHDELPYREDFALQPTAPYEASEGRRRPDRPQLLALLRAAGSGDPVREHLRRRRHELLAPDPRGGQRRARRAPPGAALRRLAGARLPLRRGCRARLPGDRRRARPRRGSRPGLQCRRRAPLSGAARWSS